jgi:hypothetical protein
MKKLEINILRLKIDLKKDSNPQRTLSTWA